MSGDLGNHAHLVELLELTSPHFDVSIHGLAVGNNLIKASIDTGQLQRAHQLLRQHQQQQRPDWAQNLAFWENEISQARHGTTSPVSADQLKVAFLQISGPLWLKSEHPTAEFFPAPMSDSPSVCFLGSTFETAVALEEVKAGLSNNPGRFSRALPLFLNEVFHQSGLSEMVSTEIGQIGF